MNPAEPDALRFRVSLARRQQFAFLVDFHEGDVPGLTVDEPSPLGEGRGPNATRVLAAAIGQCLASSLLYCLQRARVPVTDLTARVEGELVRNSKGRLRVGAVNVTLAPRVGDDPARITRCLALFEEFCTVTQSVRDGIDVKVRVEPVAATEPALATD